MIWFCWSRGGDVVWSSQKEISELLHCQRCQRTERENPPGWKASPAYTAQRKVSSLDTGENKLTSKKSLSLPSRLPEALLQLFRHEEFNVPALSNCNNRASRSEGKSWHRYAEINLSTRRLGANDSCFLTYRSLKKKIQPSSRYWTIQTKKHLLPTNHILPWAHILDKRLSGRDCPSWCLWAVLLYLQHAKRWDGEVFREVVRSRNQRALGPSDRHMDHWCRVRPLQDTED